MIIAVLESEPDWIDATNGLAGNLAVQLISGAKVLVAFEATKPPNLEDGFVLSTTNDIFFTANPSKIWLKVPDRADCPAVVRVGAR